MTEGKRLRYFENFQETWQVLRSFDDSNRICGGLA